jgi:hypothetical protein
MDWQAIREQHPQQWLVVEAFDAYSENGQRVIPHLEVIQAFGSDSMAAWSMYKSLHRADTNREYYVLHTDREELNIGVLDVFGRVVAE